MSKTLDIIQEVVNNRHRARNEAIKRILTRHKTGVINQSVANQQLKSCGHPGLNMEEWRVDNPTPKEHVVFHDDAEIGHIRNDSGIHHGTHYPTGKKFTTSTHSNALKTIQKLHSNHIRISEEFDHHGFTPGQMIKRKHFPNLGSNEFELKDAKYVGPHHNKEYATIIDHRMKKVHEKWENLVKEELANESTEFELHHIVGHLKPRHQVGKHARVLVAGPYASKKEALNDIGSFKDHPKYKKVTAEPTKTINHLPWHHQVKEEITNESLPANASSSDYVDDFVHSKNKMFKGDNTKQRIRRALGAYYSKHQK
jgi:hypothetical protein